MGLQEKSYFFLVWFGLPAEPFSLFSYIRSDIFFGLVFLAEWYQRKLTVGFLRSS